MEKKVHETALKYDITCESYEELYGEEQYEKYSRILPGIAGYLEGSILGDFGSGPLLFFDYLEKTGYDKKISYYIALDVSLCLLMHGRDRFIERNNMDIVLGDILHLPLRDKSIDIFVSVTVIGNLSDSWKRGVKNMVDSCKGKGVVTVLNIKDNTGIIRELGLANKKYDLGKDVLFILNCDSNNIL